MPGHPTFAVVVPCYGHEQHLREAIESVWAQTFQDLEVVAIDDGSPDRSGALLDELERQAPVPMRVVHRSNEGAAAALNVGAGLARGTYLAFLNDDDAYAPDRLDAFARELRQRPDFVWGYSAVEVIDVDSMIMPVEEVPDVNRRNSILLSRSPLESARLLNRDNSVVSSGNLVVRRDVFAGLSGFRPFIHVHDWDLILRLLAVAPPVVLERRLYRYRVHSGNAFLEALQGPGAREARAVYDENEHRRLELATFVPRLAGGSTIPLAADEARAVRVSLSALRLLRRMPPAYAAVRLVVVALRGSRRTISALFTGRDRRSPVPRR